MKKILNIFPTRIKNNFKESYYRFRMNSSRPRIEPSFIIVGAQKAGTTSLYSYLIQHPNIISAWIKEIHFFDNNYHMGEQWYRGFFPFQCSLDKECITGESSPYYLFHPRVPKRIFQMYPKMKLIIVLRNPVDRAISHYQHMVNYGVEKRQLWEALQGEKNLVYNDHQKIIDSHTFNSMDHQNFSYTSRGRYLEQIKEYLKYFSTDQILIIDSNKLFYETESVLKIVYNFLNIESIFSQINLKPNNIGRYHNFIPTQKSKNYLENYFRPYNEELFQYLGRNFDWSE